MAGTPRVTVAALPLEPELKYVFYLMKVLGIDRLEIRDFDGSLHDLPMHAIIKSLQKTKCPQCDDTQPKFKHPRLA